MQSITSVPLRIFEPSTVHVWCLTFEFENGISSASLLCFMSWQNVLSNTTFVSFIPFFVFGHFWRRSYKNTKILCNPCLHFARQDGQDRKENHATKVTKIPKNKRRKYGMNETNITEHFFWNTTGQENQFWVVSKISYCKAQAMKVTSSIIFVVCYAVVFLLDATTN